MVVIPGFLTGSRDGDPELWADSLRAGRFGGDVWVVRWDSGSPWEMAAGTGGTAFAGAALVKLLALGPLAWPVIGVGAAAAGWYYWRSKLALARSIGPTVRSRLRSLRRRYEYRELIVVAHSLGVEMTWSMLESSRGPLFDRVVLLGGASSATDGCWESLDLEADIYNVGHHRDRILSFFYLLAERDLPLGLAVSPGKLIDVDTGGLGLPFPGHQYHSVFEHWDAPHRWRPVHFG